MTPTVSVAMTTYNGVRYLRQQVESVLAQQYPILELVISDDGSDDGSFELIQELARGDSRIRLLPRGERLGFNDNFMRCFSACRGELISPCDQDDVWAPEKTGKLVSAFEPGGVAYCDSRFVDADGVPFQGRRTRISDTMAMGDDPPLLGLLMNNCIAGHAMLFDRSLLDDLGAIPEHSYFDWWIVLRARAAGRPFRYVDETLVSYRRHADAVTTVTAASRARRKARSLRSHYDTASALAASAEAPGVEAYRRALEAWLGGVLPLRAFVYFWRHRHEIFHTKAGRSGVAAPALGYLLGYRLKHRLMPTRYPDLRVGPGGRLLEQGTG